MVEIRFEKKAGKASINMLVIQKGEKPAVFESVEPATYNAAGLHDFKGEYYSDEVDSRSVIVVQEGKLVVQKLRGEDVILQSEFADAFANFDFGLVRFARDQQKQVVGFLLDLPQNRNLRFKRMK